MTSTSSIALSGMQTAQTRLNSTAHNVANLATEGFRRQEVTQAEQPQGGATASIRRASTAGEALEKDVVEQLQAKNAFLANLAVFKTSNKMAGALLDKTA